MLLWNINLTQKNAKISLLHEDRRAALEKLFNIIENSPKYYNLKQRIEDFMKSLEYNILPDDVKNVIYRRLADLDSLARQAPNAPPEVSRAKSDMRRSIFGYFEEPSEE